MEIKASINSSYNNHIAKVQTNNTLKQLTIPHKPGGYGSSVNGGELLALALATCYCNDIYREAAKRNIHVTSVEVEVSSEYGAEGEAGKNFSYKAHITADAPQEIIEDLLKHTDTVAEIQNTLRKGAQVQLIYP